MTDYRPGDIVRGIKGEPGKPGWVERIYQVVPYGEGRGDGQISDVTIQHLARWDFEFELVSRCVPKEPGTIGRVDLKNGLRDFIAIRSSADYRPWRVFDRNGDFDGYYEDDDFEDFTELFLASKSVGEEAAEWFYGKSETVLSDVVKLIVRDYESR